METSLSRREAIFGCRKRCATNCSVPFVTDFVMSTSARRPSEPTSGICWTCSYTTILWICESSRCYCYKCSAVQSERKYHDVSDSNPLHPKWEEFIELFENRSAFMHAIMQSKEVMVSCGNVCVSSIVALYTLICRCPAYLHKRSIEEGVSFMRRMQVCDVLRKKLPKSRLESLFS